jgi:hypothetical protein
VKATNESGSTRERRPGVWEIRVSAGVDLLSGRALPRSVTFHGNHFEGSEHRIALAGAQQVRRSLVRAAPLVTVEELMRRWLATA